MLATGGPGIVFGRSTNSVINTGTAAAAAYQQGACYANGEFIQVHPTAIPGRRQAAPDVRVRARRGRARLGAADDRRQARAARRSRRTSAGTSSRRSTPATGTSCRATSRPARSSTSAANGHRRRRKAARSTSTSRTCPRASSTRSSPASSRSTRSSSATIRAKVPMKVFPAMHYSMGGLWVDFEGRETGSLVERSPRNQATNIPGLYAGGEVRLTSTTAPTGSAPTRCSRASTRA